MAAVTVLIEDAASSGLLWVESQLGIALAQLNVAANRYKDPQNCESQKLRRNFRIADREMQNEKPPQTSCSEWRCTII